MLGKVRVKNRIVLAPMGVGIRNPDATLPSRILPYLEARAAGGTGLIISEFANVSKYQTTVLLGAYGDRFIPGLTEYANAIHKHDAKVFLQLGTLGGRDDLIGKHRSPSYAPSAIESPLYRLPPKELTANQIKEVIGEFIEAGRRAQQADFDGVELHAAHAYLIGQFMSPHFNRRDDEYGGDFERRMRFPTEIFKGIKKTCGKDFPVGLKFSAWEEVPNGIDHELALKIAQRMADEGVAYVHPQSIADCSQYVSLPSIYSPRNNLVELAENIKRSVRNVPVMAAGGIVDPKEADKIIADGKADMVALGRALLADPDWPNKAREGRRIRPCIRCNVCHREVVLLWKEAVCSVNTHLVRELDEPLHKATMPRTVAVVGAGPAGIVAALTASRRGHDVTLYEMRGEIGGLLVPASAPPFKRDLKALLEYYDDEIRDSRVKLELDTEVTPDVIDQLHPDVLVVAIGARPIRPDIRGIDGDNVVTAEEALQSPDQVDAENVVVIGGGTVGCETAVFFAQRQQKVVVVEALEKLFSLEEIHPSNTLALEEMLEEAGVRTYNGSKVVEISSNDVWIVRSGERLQRLPADLVVLAVGRRPDSGLVDLLKERCPNTYTVGDCVKPARVFEAVHEADRIARLL